MEQAQLSSINFRQAGKSVDFKESRNGLKIYTTTTNQDYYSEINRYTPIDPKGFLTPVQINKFTFNNNMLATESRPRLKRRKIVNVKSFQLKINKDLINPLLAPLSYAESIRAFKLG